MNTVKTSLRMEEVHSDIRGPLFFEAMELQKQGRDILRLNTGNPATFGFTMPKSVKDALAAGTERALGYCDFKGMPDAREAICAYHESKGIQGITPDDVFIGNGVSEVVSFALTPLLNEGDEVLLPTPCYSLWSNSVRIAGGTPVFYTCDEMANWMPDLADIQRKITAKTRAIVLINPNNPTGALYAKDLLEGIARLAREHRLLVFSDEIYDRLVLDGLTHTSIAALAPDIPVITMNGLSKSHSLCGLRAGWMVISGPRAVTAAYREAIIAVTSMRLCANTMAQLTIPAALADEETPRAMVSPGGRIYEQREATVSVLSRVDGLTFVKNRAAFYLFPRLDREKFGVTDDRRFARDLLHTTGILLVPGSGFEYPHPDHFRIVMLPEKEILADAMHRLGHFLDGYYQR
ncbi:MAG: aminotransferase class I/II-fold pyridoxal phosphate-dependent enzyme [Ruminococcaceae bacterium]|nr:aminotransferase class I/II-fold pyridoxal phosphate-dependent enzyme [Oscillospiraceae bacterium]